MLDIHTHHSTPMMGQEFIYNQGLEALEKGAISYDAVSLGLHPWELREDNMESQLSLLESNVTDFRVKLIGECGFDRLRGGAMDLQKEAFLRQLSLAEGCKKPMIIHCVKAYDELIACKKELGPTIPMIIHGFNKSVILGRQLLDHGFLLSFGAAILQEGSPAATLLTEIRSPYFLETDDSRHSLADIYKRASFLQNSSVMELKDLIFAAWKKIGLK